MLQKKRPMDAKTIGIAGLGLMGGSLAIALRKEYKNVTLYGYDHNSEHAKEALELKLIDTIVDDYRKLNRCDVLFLATPIDGSIEILQNLSDITKETTIIDLGSTKALISNRTPEEIRENIVAAHPMTGTEKSGPNASFEGLYTDKTVVLCDMGKSGEYQQEQAKKIFTDIGMKIVYMESKEHDRHAAYISHMPHAISYALANSVMKQEDPKSIVALAGGGGALAADGHQLFTQGGGQRDGGQRIADPDAVDLLERVDALGPDHADQHRDVTFGEKVVELHGD